VSAFVSYRLPQLAVAALCLGLAAANIVRPPPLGLGLCVAVLVVAGVLVEGRVRVCALGGGLLLAGLLWGTARLDAIDASRLSPSAGMSARTRVVVIGPLQRGRFDARGPGLALRFGATHVREPVLLRLPRGRAPPQGAILEGVGQLIEPRGPKNGFDERTWLRRHGMHVILRLSTLRVVGRRGGIGGLADAVRRRLQRSVAHGLSGERAAVVEGVVLGEDSGLSEELRQRFRAAGIYHLLAVSGQNVALVAGATLLLVWLLGLPRFAGQLAALTAIAAYVLAVGAQPSVVRAGVAGALGSLAWLTARAPDRWHFLLIGALVLLAWNPYTLLDAGFQLSFAAVIAIFVLVPPFDRFLEGYPLSRSLRLVVAISAACGLATAPIAWAHFHSLQLLTIPANALAAPAAASLLWLALAATAVAPISPSAAAAVAWLNGWCAAYLVEVARFVGGLPFAQIQSTRSLLLVLSGALLVAAYASGAVGPGQMNGNLEAGLDGRTGEARTASTRRPRVGA
jgi:ComEC/Rec2-related protein